MSDRRNFSGGRGRSDRRTAEDDPGKDAPVSHVRFSGESSRESVSPTDHPRQRTKTDRAPANDAPPESLHHLGAPPRTMAAKSPSLSRSSW